MNSVVGIQRFHRRLIADHPYTRRHQIVSNIVKGGKCPFQCDFPTSGKVPKRRNDETEDQAIARIKDHRVKDVILLQGTIFSKTILLKYTSTRSARIGSSSFWRNPTGNGQRFTKEDVEMAPFSLKGKDLLEYAMRSTGEDADTSIFRHEVKIILAKDLGISLKEDQDYDLFWYVSQLEKASTKVEDEDAGFNHHLQQLSPTRPKLRNGNPAWDLVYYSLYYALVLFLPAVVSNFLFRATTKPGSLEEATEDASAAKEELMSKNKELLKQQEQIRLLKREVGSNESVIASMKAKMERLERQQEELVQDRDKYCNVVHRVENVARIHKAYMESFYNFAAEATHLQTELDGLRQEGNTR